MVKPSVDAVDIDPKTGSTLGFYTFGADRPRVLITSTFDGRSAVSMYTSYLIMRSLEGLSRVNGAVTILPVANPLAFRLSARMSPLDSQPLDNVFPGNERGTVTERLSWEIWRRASQSDYVINLDFSVQPCVTHALALHREYIHVRNLVSQLGLPYAVQSSDTRGTLHVEAAHEGIPVSTIKMRGSPNQIDPQVAVEVRESILNFLSVKNIIPGEPIESSSIYTGMLQQVYVDAEGFFVPTVNSGEQIESGDLLGKVQENTEIRAPFSGTVIAISGMSYVFEGDRIAKVASPLVDHEALEEEEDITPRRKW